jgi:hypothetical protein
MKVTNFQKGLSYGIQKNTEFQTHPQHHDSRYIIDVEDFRFEDRFSNRSQAICRLLELGLQANKKQKQKNRDTENEQLLI